MPTAIVTTKVEKNKQFEWYYNVYKAVISNQIREIDYWTNNWLPSKQQNPDRIEVYYKGYLAFAGEIIQTFKKSPVDVYNQYATNLSKIGLRAGASLADFQKMIINYFPKYTGPDIGNIVFKIDEIGFTKIGEMDKIGMLGTCSNLKRVLSEEIPFKQIRRVRYI